MSVAEEITVPGTIELTSGSFDVNPGFIEVGQLHECIRFGREAIQDPRNPGTSMANWQWLFIESVEVIGGQVFLGTRRVMKVDDEGNFVLNDTVMYENLFSFRHLQRYGTAWKNELECRAYNDKLNAELQAAREEAEKAATEQPEQHSNSIDTDGQ